MPVNKETVGFATLDAKVRVISFQPSPGGGRSGSRECKTR